jgi:hypothetical protein
LREWHIGGRVPACWARVRRILKELHPEARWNSIEAVVRHAQGAAAVARLQAKNGPDYVPPARVIPDVRRLIRDAFRE